MIVAITGHRPNKIPDTLWVAQALFAAYAEVGAEHVIQGMAAGVDLLSAKCAYLSGIPFTCAKPWKGHTPRKEDEPQYAQALKYAQRVVNVTEYEEFPGNWCYQKRNEWMVDNADVVIAVWDGSRGGTHNCYKYAEKVDKPIYLIDPLEQAIHGWVNG